MRSVLAIWIGAFHSISMACDSGPKDIIDLDDDPVERDKDLDQVTLPPGFRIDLYAKNVPNARSLAQSENRVLFVGTREGTVYAVVDRDDDFVADTTFVIDETLRLPNGVAVRDGDLYVAEVSRILRYDQIEAKLDQPPEPVVVFDMLPTDGHHGWKYIAFGPDGKLYVPIGAPCNICDQGQPYAALWRMNADGSNFELCASGIRNTVGFDWHPVSVELWFTDNQRDHLGDDVPDDELNYARRSGSISDFRTSMRVRPPILTLDRVAMRMITALQRRNSGLMWLHLGWSFTRATCFPLSTRTEFLSQSTGRGIEARRSDTGLRLSV